MDTSPKDCLYVSDLDGTLLGPGGHFPDANADRLNRLIERGLKFSIATARSYDSAHPILHRVNFQIPVILFNGVYLTEFATGNVLQLSNFIPHEAVHAMLELVAPLKLDPFIYTYGAQPRLYYRNASNPGAQHYLKSLEGDGRLRQVETFEFVDDESIAGFLLIDRPMALNRIYEILKTQYKDEMNLYYAEDISNPGYYWLQAYHHDADKGSMLRKLSKHMEIPLSQVVVFGDYLNDMKMFQVAGKSIAVDNALLELKVAANEVIGRNTEGAVLNYLESLGF